ncbi:MAG: N-acetyltransferase [Terrimonas sp.]|nr:N-acetyltransferase [Terrimonas sp.]OJY95567.1 MAG: GNAT family N-acetyltransferase [Sphingobacteriales bacterium 40-81]
MAQVRLATDNDIQAILDIYNYAIVYTTAVYDYEPHSFEMRRQWFETKKQQNFPVFVAEDNNEVVGFSSIGPFRAWAAYKFTVENAIYVRADQQGKGIGKLLMQPLIDASRKLGMHTIVSGIDADNEVSLKMHRRFGFEEVAHFKQVGWKFDKWLDLKFMQLML